MKKLIFLSFLCCSFVITTYAQISYGVEVGAGISGVSASNAEYTPKFSPRIGAFINYDKVFSSGLYYTRKGSKIDEFIPQYAGYIQSLSYSTNYVELVPVSLLLEKQLSSKISVGITLGLYVAYGFGGKGTLTGIDINQSLFSNDIKNIYKNEKFYDAIGSGTEYKFDAFKAFDYGARFGVSVGVSKQFRIKLEESIGNQKLVPYDKHIYDLAAHLSVCYTIK